jgi:hypothetical protein
VIEAKFAMAIGSSKINNALPSDKERLETMEQKEEEIKGITNTQESHGANFSSQEDGLAINYAQDMHNQEKQMRVEGCEENTIDGVMGITLGRITLTDMIRMLR